MPDEPLASVVVPSYNAAHYLGLLCASIQAQTYRNFEVLIGDDGSQDNTAEVVAPFLADSRFRLLSWSRNRTYPQALITLLAEARGEFWCGPGFGGVAFSGGAPHESPSTISCLRTGFDQRSLFS